MKYKKIKNGKYEIYIDNKKIITYDEIIIKNNILYKDSINIDLIKKENEYYDIYYKCIKLINKRLRTIKEISSFASEDIINRLIKEGYLNDERYTKSFIHDKLIFSNDSPKMIKYSLIKKGINSNIIETEITKIDEKIVINKIEKILKKYDNNKKAINYLLSKGYDYYFIENITKKNQD